jgi:hypothetical protein
MARQRSNGQQSKTIGDQLRAAAATIVKAVVLEIDANLRRAPSQGGTPVATGYARANWVPSIGAPHEGAASGEGAHAAGLSAVLGYVLEDGAAYVSNSAAYIEALNHGHSTQAPALFIEAAVDQAIVTMQARYGSAAIQIERFRDAVGGQGAANLASAYSPFGEG